MDSVETFISDILGVKAKHRGLYGDTEAYYGTVEQQGRLTLHLHMLLWLTGNLRPQEIHERLLDPDLSFQKKMIACLESVHTGNFQSGTFDDVVEGVKNKVKTRHTRIQHKLCQNFHLQLTKWALLPSF